MMAVELVEAGTTTPDPAMAKAVAAEAHRNGVVVLTCGTYGNVLRFLPPLAISDDAAARGVRRARRGVRRDRAGLSVVRRARRPATSWGVAAGATVSHDVPVSGAAQRTPHE